MLKREVEATFQNLQGFEGRLLTKLLQTQVHELNGKPMTFFQTCLVKPVRSDQVWKAQQLHAPGNFHFHVRNPVVSTKLDWAGVIAAFEQNGSLIYVEVTMYVLQDRISSGIYIWKPLNATRKMEWRSDLCVTPRYYRLDITEMITVW